MPKHDMIFLVVTNAGNDAANQAVKDIGAPLKIASSRSSKIADYVRNQSMNWCLLPGFLV
jgi:hypothetical protein